MRAARNDIRVARSGHEWARLGAEIFKKSVEKRLKDRPRFAFVASGGRTPQSVYETLATGKFRDELPWGQIHWSCPGSVDGLRLGG